MPATPGFNLALVYQADRFSPEDYQAIAHEIRKAATDIDIYIVADSPGPGTAQSRNRLASPSHI